MNTRIKVCGITRPEDALVASRLGVDAIGLVFYPPSSRYVEIEQARDIIKASNPLVTVVGLFVDADPDWVSDLLDQLPLQMLQFHGDETAQYCRYFNRPFIKALRVKEDAANLQEQLHRFPEATALLFDSYSDAVQGGSGEGFNWSLIPGNCNQPIILAGGLNPDNVAAAVTQVRPHAVDVCSGVEASPGIKNQTLITDFVVQVKTAQINHQRRLNSGYEETDQELD